MHFVTFADFENFFEGGFPVDPIAPSISSSFQLNKLSNPSNSPCWTGPCRTLSKDFLLFRSIGSKENFPLFRSNNRIQKEPSTFRSTGSIGSPKQKVRAYQICFRNLRISISISISDSPLHWSRLANSFLLQNLFQKLSYVNV